MSTDVPVTIVDEYNTLTPEQRDIIDGYLLKGYTVRRIQMLLLTRGETVIPSPKAILSIYRSEEQITRLKRLQKITENAQMSMGIARKPERLRRLQELADKLETEIFEEAKPNAKAAELYIRTLKQAAEETDPTTASRYSADQDAWSQLTAPDSNNSPSSSASVPLLPSGPSSSASPEASS